MQFSIFVQLTAKEKWIKVFLFKSSWLFDQFFLEGGGGMAGVDKAARRKERGMIDIFVIDWLCLPYKTFNHSQSVFCLSLDLTHVQVHVHIHTHTNTRALPIYTQQFSGPLIRYNALLNKLSQGIFHKFIKSFQSAVKFLNLLYLFYYIRIRTTALFLAWKVAAF